MSVEYKKRYYKADTFRVDMNGKGVAESDNGVLTSDSSFCDCSDGTLQRGVGMTIYLRDEVEVPIPSKLPEADFFFRSTTGSKSYLGDTLYYVSTDGKLYSYYDLGMMWSSVYDFQSRMKAVRAVDSEGKEWILFSGATGVYKLNEQGEIDATSIKAATNAACFYKDRVFCGIEPYTIAYSAPLSPTNFTASVDNGGQISLPADRGKIVALVPMKNALYIFYEYGISVLKGAGTPRDFVVETIGYDGGKLFGDSVGVCSAGGDKAFFLAERGMYVFNGNQVKRVCENIRLDHVLEGQVCAHAEFDGKYYLSYVGLDGLRKGLCIDAETESGYLTFYSSGASVDNGLAICLSENYVRKFRLSAGTLRSGDVYKYRLRDVDFGCYGLKSLKTLILYGRGSVVVTVRRGKKKREKELSLTDGKAKMKIGLRGETFDVEILLLDDGRISALEAELLTLEGNVQRRFGNEN